MQDADDPALVVNPPDHHFMSARFRAHQIVRLLEFASTEPYLALLSRSIARAFEVSHSALADHEVKVIILPPSMSHIFLCLVEDNVRSAFRQLGLPYDIETSTSLLFLDEIVLRPSSSFTSL
jgi:hypothetical protein